MKTDEQMAMEYANRATGRYTPGSAIDEAYITGSRDGAARQREQDAKIADDQEAIEAGSNSPDEWAVKILRADTAITIAKRIRLQTANESGGKP